jgi:hypothetical protein
MAQENKPEIKEDEYNPFEEIAGLVAEEGIVLNSITVRKMVSDKWEICRIYEHNNFTTNDIGRLFGGGQYQMIMSYRKGGGKPKAMRSKQFRLNDFWDRVRDGEIDEKGQEIEPGDEPENDLIQREDIGTSLARGLNSVIANVGKLLVESGMLQAWLSRNGGGGDMFKTLYESSEKRFTKMLDIMVQGAESKGDIMLKGMEKMINFQSKHLPAAAGDNEEPQTDHFIEIIKMLKDNFPMVMKFLKKDNPQAKNILNNPKLKQAIAPDQLPATYEELKKHLGDKKAKEVLKNVGADIDNL